MGTAINRRRVARRSGGINYAKMYFTIEAMENGCVVSVKNVGCTITPMFNYSTDGGATWNAISTGINSTKAVATINSGDTVLFKSTLVQLATAWDKYNCFSCSKRYQVYGNAMSLLYNDNFISNGEFANDSDHNFCSLFRDDTHIIDASNLILPSLILPPNVYNGMFRDCSNLTTAPKLPALTFMPPTSTGDGDHYSSMFEGCINLEEAPELPATSLVSGCYNRMFCMSRTATLKTPKMTKSPVLPAPIVPATAYKEMFKGNGNLVEVTCLATDITEATSTSSWLLNCSTTGIFVKNANMTSWTRSTSGIPTGWTVYNQDEVNYLTFKSLKSSAYSFTGTV